MQTLGWRLSRDLEAVFEDLFQGRLGGCAPTLPARNASALALRTHVGGDWDSAPQQLQQRADFTAHLEAETRAHLAMAEQVQKAMARG
jgi:hypothetical protein